MSDAVTLQDIVAHVMDSYDLSNNVVDVRRAIRSAVWGYDQATTRHKWSAYDSQFTAYFNAAYSTGTVDIDAAGVVTLTGGTWPAWANLALVYIGEERAYRVLTRGSDTSLTLENWTGETETGITYTLRQDRVYIPDEVREVFDVWQEREDWGLRIVDPKTFRDYDRPRIYTGSDPHFVTFRSVLVDGVHKTEMRISPGATTAAELDVAYVRRPRQANVLIKSEQATTGANTVTLSSPLPVGMNAVGTMIRISSNEDYPDADLTFGFADTNQATFEGLVEAQASTTSLTVTGVPSLPDASVVITSVLDIPPFLVNPVKMYAEAQMARMGRGDIKMYQTLLEHANEELRYAMEQDIPVDRRGVRPMVYVDRLQATPYVVEA